MSHPKQFDPLLTCLTREQLLEELTDVLYINAQFKKEVVGLEEDLSTLEETFEAVRSKFLEFNDRLADAQEALDGKSLCAGKECKMHCGLGHLQGCEAVKAYLKENGGQID